LNKAVNGEKNLMAFPGALHVLLVYLLVCGWEYLLQALL